MMQQRWRQIPLPCRPHRLRCIAAPIICRPQIAQLAATQRAVEPTEPQPQRKYYGVFFDRSKGKHRAIIYVPRSQVSQLPESLQRPGKTGRVKLTGGTYLTAEEAARATDKILHKLGLSHQANGLLTPEEVAQVDATPLEDLVVKQSSTFVGVTWREDLNKWGAQIRFLCNTYNLGRFDDEVKAALVADEAALIVHDGFADDLIKRAEVLNFPDRAPPPPSGFTVIRTDEQKAADLNALAAENRRRMPKTSSHWGVAKVESRWQAAYRGIYLGRYEGEAEAALVHDQALLYDLGREKARKRANFPDKLPSEPDPGIKAKVLAGLARLNARKKS